MTPRRIGLVVLVCFLLRALDRLVAHDPYNLLWACHTGCLLVAIGLLTRHRRLTQLATLWMCLGNLLWGLDLLAGAAATASTVLTHFGGLFGGLLGIQSMGGWQPTRLLWLWSMLAGQALIQLSRWLTPFTDNINLAFFIEPGWEWMFFHSLILYHVFLAAFSSALFFVCDLGFRRFLPYAPLPTALSSKQGKAVSDP